MKRNKNNHGLMFWVILIAIVSFFLLLTKMISDNRTNQMMIEELEEIVSEPFEGQLSTDLERLMSDKNTVLKLKIGEKSYYQVTSKLAGRILENLQDSKSLDRPLEVAVETDVVLLFSGYQPVHINRALNLFWFEDDTQFYKSRYLEGLLWERCLLEELNGMVQYTRFENDIMKQYHEIDHKAHGKSDIVLYFDGDIRVNINGSDFVVNKFVDPKAIGNVKSYNLYDGRLDVIKGVNSEVKLIVAGYQYTFVNRYSSSSFFKVIKVNDNGMVEVWDTDEILNALVTVKSYDKDQLIVVVEGISDELVFQLSPNEAKELESFDKWLQEGGQTLVGRKAFQFFSNLTDYQIKDYDGDGKEELVCYFYMRGGAAGITSYVVGIYDISNGDFKLKSLEESQIEALDMDF